MKVVSSNIREIWYNDKKKILAVRFKRKPFLLYNYKGVAKNVWIDLIKSKSKGVYFDQCVNGKYSYKKKNFNFSSIKYEELFL